MIPFAAEIHIRSRRQRQFHLWIPLPVLWILLFPFVVLSLPLFVIGCLIANLDPFRGIAAVWRILTSLADTELAVDYPDHSFSMHLY